MSPKDLMQRCRVVDGHWLWIGATRIWAPEFTLHNGAMRSQTPRRAMWHVKTGQPIAPNWRVFGTCREPTCINPDHMECVPTATRGAKVAASGKLKGQVARIAANRAMGRKRSTLTPELIAEVLGSPEYGLAVAARLGLSRSVVSKVRSGKPTAFTPIGGLFTGLMA